MHGLEIQVHNTTIIIYKYMCVCVHYNTIPCVRDIIYRWYHSIHMHLANTKLSPDLPLQIKTLATESPLNVWNAKSKISQRASNLSDVLMRIAHLYVLSAYIINQLDVYKTTIP